MAKNRGKLSRVLNAASGIQKLAENPFHGHHRIKIRMEDNPYPSGFVFKEGKSCIGCGKQWSELETAGFLPVCTKPGEEVNLIITYRSDSKSDNGGLIFESGLKE